ncbi:TRAP-type C4-dicarboxylate transport system, large permease component [Olavius sp. associated proteobacterium Delta 1]|nr:TRAP-type C4-dicarboxylate transport system, large permease component [Olavius sp. associated proteobacterium Delta 1]
MDPFVLGILSIILMIALTFMGVPIALALLAIGAAGNIYLMGLPQTAMQVHMITWETGTNFLLIAVPLFVFMGQLVYHTQIASDLYDFVHKWFGRLPGGLAVTGVFTSAGFGAVTGSSVAAIATMGIMVMPEMKKYKYNLQLATGSLASAGTLAIMIPPSIPMVIYGVWTETSIGKLFIAGVIPGILLAAGFCAMIVVRCLMDRQLGPAGPVYSWTERLTALTKLMPTAIIFIIVLGGIYGGVFTPTEASAIGAVGVLAVALAMRRLTVKRLKESLWQTGEISAMIYAILIGGVMFSRLLVQTDVTPALVNYIASLQVSPHSVIFLFSIMFLLLGAVLDTFGMLILTLPLVFPICRNLGFDPVWFGIYMTVMMEIAMLTPPIGLNVFVMQRVTPEVPLSEIFRGVLPFVIICLLLVVLIVAFPQLALWLPSTMG